MRDSIFDARPVIQWYRIHDFQLVSLKLIAEQLLLNCPSYKEDTKLPMFIPGELTTVHWGFKQDLRVYCSPNNPGAEQATLAIRRTLADALRDLNDRKSRRQEGTDKRRTRGSSGSTSHPRHLVR